MDEINPSKTKGSKFIIISTIIVVLLAAAIITICIITSSSDEAESIPTKKLLDINADYPLVSANDPEYTYIPIFGINDMHSFVFPRIREVNETLSYKTGGLEYFSKYLEIIRQEFGEDRVIWLDGGDQHTGGVEAELSDNEIMTDFMNDAKITATTIGNHEYDLKFDVLKKKINKSKFPYLCANTLNNETLEFYSYAEGTSNANGHKKYMVKEIKLKNGDTIKIGIIGVGAVMSYLAGENYLNAEEYPNIEFKDITEAIIDTVKELKEEHNDLNSIIATIHAGTKCGKNENLGLFTKNTIQNECELNIELTEILNKLESGLLDAVVSGDKSIVVHHWINDIPVISGLEGGLTTNILYLPFKKIDGKYKVVKEQVKIEGPLPNCEKIFNKTKVCLGVTTETDYINDGPLVEFSYRGVKMERSSYMSSIYKNYYPDYKIYSEDEVCRIYGLNTTIKGKDRSGDGYATNLFSDIVNNLTHADVTILNAGSFRTSWNMGKITKADVISMFPFIDYLCTAKITGADLKLVLGIIQKGEKGYYPTSGLKQIMKVADNGTKELTEVSLWVNGVETPIDDEKEYILGSLDYILIGYGDDFDGVKSYGYKFKDVVCENKDESLKYGPRILEALKNLKKIDITTYVDPKHPRLIEESNSLLY